MMQISHLMALRFCLILVSPAHAAQSSKETACVAGAAPLQSACIDKAYREVEKSIDENSNGKAVIWKAEPRKAQPTSGAFRKNDCDDLVIYEWGKGPAWDPPSRAALWERRTARA